MWNVLLLPAPDRGPDPGLAGAPAFFASPAPIPGKSEAISGDGPGISPVPFPGMNASRPGTGETEIAFKLAIITVLHL